MFDALIAGGGPAGLVAGLCLARGGARVAILEAAGYKASRFGETLPPEINPVLRELGLWDAFESIAPVEAPGIVCRWGTASALEQDFVSNPHGAGWRVNRNAFDAMLANEACRAGAQVFTARKAGAVDRSRGMWGVDGIRARFLVDATGRNGLRLEARYAQEVDDVLLAITLVMTYDGPAPVDGRTYIETAPAGWWYSGLLPDGNVMAMFFTDPETYNGEGVVIADQLAAAPLTRARLETARIGKSRVVYAPSSCRKAIAGEDWMAVGDSASCYDPLSGRGIFKALRQGTAAARALVAGPTGIAEYVGMVRREFESYVRQRRLFYASERRWADAGFWFRRTLGPSEARVAGARGDAPGIG